MRTKLFGLLLIVIFAVLAAAQQNPSNTSGPTRFDLFPADMLARFQHSQFGGDVSQQSCTVVSTEGRFHIEKNDRNWAYQSGPHVKVFEGILTTEELAALRTLLETEEFRALSQHIDPRAYGRAPTNEVLILAVRHGKDVQNVSLMTAEDWKQYKKPVKPVLDWLVALENRKLKETKGAPTSRCFDVPKGETVTTGPKQ